MCEGMEKIPRVRYAFGLPNEKTPTLILLNHRHTAATVAYLDQSGVSRESLFTGADLVCIQHFIDIFQGHWPCDGTQPRVPRRLEEL
jgi:peptide deformylase